MSNNSSNNSGVSFLSLLTLIFIVLKLTNVINWSWWYITMPLCGGVCIGLCLLVVVLF